MKVAKAIAIVIGALTAAAIAIVLVIAHLYSKQQDKALEVMKEI
jgi:hypothetical protein